MEMIIQKYEKSAKTAGISVYLIYSICSYRHFKVVSDSVSTE